MFKKSVFSALVLAAFLIAPHTADSASVYIKKKQPVTEAPAQEQQPTPAPTKSYQAPYVAPKQTNMGGVKPPKKKGPPATAMPAPCTAQELAALKEIDKAMLSFTGPAAAENEKAKKWQAYFADPANAKIMGDLYMRCGPSIIAQRKLDQDAAALRQIEHEKELKDKAIKKGVRTDPDLMDPR